jgi:hypothetical protein
VQPAQVSSAIANAKAGYDEDIKNVVGLYAANMGDSGPEKSGKAIIAQQRKGDTTNYHFTDNLSRAIRHCTRICVDLIPEIYDTPRVIRILGEDMKDDIVQVNALFNDPKTGEPVFYDLSVGRYDVIVDIGPSYATQRVEAAENLMQFVQVVPESGQIVGDLIAKNLDFPGADVMAERLKRLVPPQVLGEEAPQQLQQEFSPEDIQQIVGDLQALQQENEALKAQLGQAGNENQHRDADREADIEKERIRAQAGIEKQIVAGMTRVPNNRPAMAQRQPNQPGSAGR